MFLRAVCAEKAPSRAGLAIGSDRKALPAEFTIVQLTRIGPLLLVHHCICQLVIVVVVVVVVRLPSSAGLTAGEFFALLYFFDGLLSLALL